MAEEVNVVFAFDTKFCKLAAVSIYSLLKHAAPSTKYAIHCMVPIHTKGRKRIQNIISKYPNSRLIWKKIRKSDNPYKNYDFSRWSPVIFYRLFAHKAFPNLKKMLYIDSDTLICGDLSDLYNTNISNYVMAAVRDMAPTEIPENANGAYVKKFSEEYLNNGPYFNSGVLLLNLEKMQQQENLLKQTKIPLKYPDQDLLNVAFINKIKALPLKYNYGPCVYISSNFPKTQVKEVNDGKYKILHFYTIKPYYYSLVPEFRYFYSMFYKLANAIDLYPDDFIIPQKHERQDAKTVFPFITIKNGKLKLFGITIKRF